MERQRNNGDFEKLLRDNANQYRMYPSEKVWNNIHSALHTRRRWYGITAAIMFLVTGTIVSLIIFNGDPDKDLKGKNIARSELNIKAKEKKINQAYTPSVKEIADKSNKPKNVEELVRDNQAFSYHKINSEEASIIVNQPDAGNSSNNITTVLLPVIGEPSFNEPFYTDPNLIKFNSEINTENKELITQFSSDNLIKDEDGLNNDTEDKINEAISALSSQNVFLTRPNKKPKITAQFYFTPTVSYRNLSENKKVINGTSYVPTIDVNNMVKHKPAMGLEFGMEGKYRLSNKLAIKAGLQFNINRYDIRAYYHSQEVATVALNSSFGRDSVTAETNFRNNYGGTNASWLENFYFQTAVPVGIEYLIAENKNVQWGVSGTIQPTYVIGDRAYVISSDFKNYARFPDLMRRWNISSGFETFVSYSTGKLRWQVGPHVRYQHLSSFVSALTVKEKLFAVGLKVGITLNKDK